MAHAQIYPPQPEPQPEPVTTTPVAQPQTVEAQQLPLLPPPAHAQTPAAKPAPAQAASPQRAQGDTLRVRGAPAGANPQSPTCDIANFEQQWLDALNAVRMRGTQQCGGRTQLPARPLVWNTTLAALAHSRSQTELQTPRSGNVAQATQALGEQVRQGGYAWRVLAEVYTAGQPSVAVALQALLRNRDPCGDLMDDTFMDVGAACTVVPTTGGNPSTASTLWRVLLGVK
jgi:uncharacterized protein YkwD